jgi:hypothetical protein
MREKDTLRELGDMVLCGECGKKQQNSGACFKSSWGDL